MANEPTKAVEPRKDLDFWLNSDKFQETVRTILPKHVSAERFFKLCTAARTKNQKLMECTPASVLQCLVDLSAMGLEPDGRMAHLIPFNTKVKDRNGKESYVMLCQLIVDYKGLVNLAYRSGQLKRMPRAEVVRENDVFEWEDGAVHHIIDWRKTKEERGKVFAAYSCVYLKDSDEPDFCTMSLEDIANVRKRSRAKDSGPWVTDWEEMAKKTVFRRQSKWLPMLSNEFYEALAKDYDSLEEMIANEEAKRREPVRPLFGGKVAALPESTSEPIDIPVDEPDPITVPVDQEEADARQLAEQLAKEQGLFPDADKGGKRK